MTLIITNSMENELRNKIVTIVQDYLGPAAERFVDRQITFHLSKKPDEIKKQDVPILINWINISINILTSDKIQADKCIERIEDLTK